MKIVFLDSYTLNPGDLDWAPLKATGEVTLYDRSSPDEIIPRSKAASILIVNKVRLDQSILDRLPDLKCICVAATGYNNIDIAAAREAGIIVCNAVNYSKESVAQHVFALLLELTNQCGLHSRSVAFGGWAASKDWCYWQQPIRELSGQIFGIYGLGNIGRQVATIAQVFGMRVIAVHKYPERDQMTGVEFVSPERLFSESNVISLHVPLTPQTKYMINKKSLATMQSSSILINTGRGDLIDEIALRDALQNGGIAAAALDVLSSEPPAADHPLIGLKNCIITPHQAWASQESRKRLMDILVQNISAFKAGSPVQVVT